MKETSWLFTAALLIAAARPGATQTVQPQLDCNWLTVDTTAKVATFQLIAGANFNGFKSGALTFTVPLNWNVAIAVRSQDTVTLAVVVIDSVKPLPSGARRVTPAFPGAMTTALTDTLRFVANKTGSYLIFGRRPGQASAGVWMRFNVSATEPRPKLSI